MGGEPAMIGDEVELVGSKSSTPPNGTMAKVTEIRASDCGDMLVSVEWSITQTSGDPWECRLFPHRFVLKYRANGNNDIVAGKQTKHKCHCDLSVILAHGCQCGGV